jgi:N utilization substance protein A
MKSEFALAFNEITERFGLSRDTVMQALEAAMVSAYRRSVNASTAQAVEARIRSDTGEVEIFAEKEVVEQVENPLTEVTVEIARQFDPQAEVGGITLVESTPKDFGRVAAQTAKQVILQRLREAERDAQYEEYSEREGDMVHGTVHSITPQAITIGLGRAEAILPRNQQIPGERFHVRDRVRVYVLEVRKSSRGPVIVVSRSNPNMLRRLLEMEVPEINQGLVEIKAIAREAGKRAKVAVAATRDGVDPVGACVGLRGVRIQSIVRDLNDEKIDVIEWNPEPSAFIAKALSPARVSGVFLDEDPDRGRTALVVVPEDQLSLAIGRAGVNARLAARLTSWRIDIKSLIEAAADSLGVLTGDPGFAEMAEAETEKIRSVEAVLLKKEETRPVTPEEYNLVTDFVNRVQSELMRRRQAERAIMAEKLEAIRASIPVTAYQVPLDLVGLSTRTFNLLSGAGYQTAGQVLETLGLDENAILGLEGVGPKSLDEIKGKLSEYPYPEPVVEPEPVPEAVEAVEALEPAEALAVEAAPGAELPVELATAVEGALAAPEAGTEAVAVPVEGAPVPALDITQSFEAALETVEEILLDEEVEEEEGELEGKLEEKPSAKKKLQKERQRIVEFDPELGETVVHRRRKASRTGEGWEETE